MADNVNLDEPVFMIEGVEDMPAAKPWLDRVDGEPVDPMTKALITATVKAGISAHKTATMFNATYFEVCEICGVAPDVTGSRIN